ncbi:NAD(P)/FAD-dependent oxidoreductase [Rhodococcus sp. IEGM 1408]|uniref:NAD(P)/FAD-dependent oxidoreductase n=1 Tax=Rhodococcus sp. IEGM 1408 TaxID=3082220 RepID=UPI00295454C4|nr:NAD(P)/FAD-dependent oxidoreductase [Rhodococcus sp. IEGM 1408]MDV8000232.1 NAD(P)/FAD-dependent oxidoreductase [Rhodococcus sp. IEGM 1408]
MFDARTDRPSDASNYPPPEAVDVLVIGGGPAGLSAATWVGRYRRSTLLVDAGCQRNLAAQEIHGTLGTGPTTPAEFYADVNEGLRQYPTVRRLDGVVTDLVKEADDRFIARIAPLPTADDGDHDHDHDHDDVVVTAKRVIMATGVRDRLPRIHGIDEHYGIDVHHCPACDGLTAADQRIIVLGVGPHVPAYASELLDWATEVVIITESDSDPAFDDDQRAACAEHSIEVIDGVAKDLVGEPGALEGVRLADGRVIAGAKVFFSYAHHPTNELAEALGCELDDEGGLVVNSLQLTSVDGVYAAGDIVTGLQLVPIAVGTGAAAGVACATSLRGHATAECVPDPAPPTRTFTRPGN